MAKWVNGAVAERMRALGFVPLPRMWVTVEERDAIMKLAQNHAELVSEIRAEVRAEREAEQERERIEKEREKAWRAMR